ncbi:MAG: hypothetical protein P8177_05545, partial [Gemmatimonadota bacterium]
AELLDAVEGLEGIWHRRATGRTFRRLAGTGSLEEEWRDASLELSGDVFTQVNRGASALLEAHVLERIRAARPDRVVDAYCGVGLYARELVRAGIDTVGIEAHPAAVREAERATPAARFLVGRVEDRLSEALPADLAILNPPRAGLHERVSRTLGSDGPDRVVYVSCDPATLARDLGRMKETYRLRGIKSFDLFPQTAHVETVVELERCATT